MPSCWLLLSLLPLVSCSWCPWTSHSCRPHPTDPELCLFVRTRVCSCPASTRCPGPSRILLPSPANFSGPCTSTCSLLGDWCPWSAWTVSSVRCGVPVKRQRFRDRCCHPASGLRTGVECGLANETDQVVDAGDPCPEEPEDEEEEVLPKEEEEETPTRIVTAQQPSVDAMFVLTTAVLPLSFVIALGAAIGAVVCCRREAMRRQILRRFLSLSPEVQAAVPMALRSRLARPRRQQEEEVPLTEMEAPPPTYEEATARERDDTATATSAPSSATSS